MTLTDAEATMEVMLKEIDLSCVHQETDHIHTRPIKDLLSMFRDLAHDLGDESLIAAADYMTEKGKAPAESSATADIKVSWWNYTKIDAYFDLEDSVFHLLEGKKYEGKYARYYPDYLSAVKALGGALLKKGKK